MLRSSSARILPTVTSTDRTADISNRLIVVTTVVATVGCVYPGFLIGAITVQVRDEFDEKSEAKILRYDRGRRREEIVLSLIHI